MEISGGMQDEMKAHLDGQFIGPTKACWKTFEFNMHRESPAVQRLPIYLPNEHYVSNGPFFLVISFFFYVSRC